ncbi:hypothetical protein TWF730_005657 [Orbilia blumenaviensis]|uniref:Uncharacterized protein n=1 Tax=Orbilia blumenaviensis TaxID=1796055 RepID=A0AAV9VLV0_9PEZI
MHFSVVFTVLMATMSGITLAAPTPIPNAVAEIKIKLPFKLGGVSDAPSKRSIAEVVPEDRLNKRSQHDTKPKTGGFGKTSFSLLGFFPRKYYDKKPAASKRSPTEHEPEGGLEK